MVTYFLYFIFALIVVSVVAFAAGLGAKKKGL